MAVKHFFTRSGTMIKIQMTLTYAARYVFYIVGMVAFAIVVSLPKWLGYGESHNPTCLAHAYARYYSSTVIVLVWLLAAGVSLIVYISVMNIERRGKGKHYFVKSISIASCLFSFIIVVYTELSTTAR